MPPLRRRRPPTGNPGSATAYTDIHSAVFQPSRIALAKWQCGTRHQEKT